MRMSEKVSGTFEVKLDPQGVPGKRTGATLGRMSIDKQFEGPLKATSAGEMLSAMTDVQGSAAYVAIEHVTGTLNGLKGSFVLQHSAWMAHRDQALEVRVVPDSGTGDLVGLSGRMDIRIEDGQHFYDFEYELPPIAG